jgi:hypothetical protein
MLAGLTFGARIFMPRTVKHVAKGLTYVLLISAGTLGLSAKSPTIDGIPVSVVARTSAGQSLKPQVAQERNAVRTCPPQKAIGAYGKGELRLNERWEKRYYNRIVPRLPRIGPTSRLSSLRGQPLFTQLAHSYCGLRQGSPWK